MTSYPITIRIADQLVTAESDQQIRIRSVPWMLHTQSDHPAAGTSTQIPVFHTGSMQDDQRLLGDLASGVISLREVLLHQWRR